MIEILLVLGMLMTGAGIDEDLPHGVKQVGKTVIISDEIFGEDLDFVDRDGVRYERTFYVETQEEE